MGLIRTAIAASLLFTIWPVPARAQARSEAPSVDQSLAFMGQLGEAVNVQAGGMKKILEAKPLLDTMTSPAAVRAAAPKARAVMEEARRTIRQVDEMLGRIVPPPGLMIGSLKPEAMIGEVREQNARAVALLGDYDAFLLAAERGDRAALVKAAPRLLEGAFLLVDGNISQFRNRQAAFPRDQSVHQALGIGVQLYRAMSISGRGWIAAKFGNRSEAVAASLRADLQSVAREARAASIAGRANLARELAEIDRKTSGLGFKGEEAAMIARFRRALAGKEKVFAVGDDLAALAEAGSRVTGAALAGQPTPQLMGQLGPLELRFQTVFAEQAAIATGKSD
jgi:hypothetical protein